MQDNYEIVQKGFRILHPLMTAYIGREMNRVYHDGWWQQVLMTLSDQSRDLPDHGDYAELMDSLDIANCLRLIDREWGNVFRTKLSIDYRTWSKELMGVRNNTAHIGQQDFDSSYAERALDTMALLSEAFEDPEGTEELRALYRTARYGTAEGSASVIENAVPVQEEKAKNSEGVLTKSVGQNLPSWRTVMQPHPDVAEGRYRAAEFAADLAQVSRGEGAYEYRDPVEFFARTYVTEGMAGLLVESLQRLSGNGGEPVIQLKTAFGGGKTHSMLALYHMVRGGINIDRVSNLKPVLDRAGLTELPRANVAVLVGTSLDPTRKKNPSNLPGHTVSTIWGEMAYQLVTSAGKPDLYEIVKDADKKGVSPGSENLKLLLNACGPCLILMDELVAYAKKIYGVDGLPAGSYDNFITFIQEITEAARASENSIVVASIPESDIEIGGDAGKTALETIEHTFGRMESIWKPVAANEGFEVVRRRLFLDCKDPETRDLVCTAFSNMYQENSADFPLEAKEVEYRNRLIACYPIHPEVFDRLYEDWATLEKFQRTRGVLRLMAAVIHELWMANDAGAMIMPGSIPLNMPTVRDELVRHLPDTWNSIIDREVDGKNSIPFQKDKANIRYGQKLAARRVARTVMLGSAPTVRDQVVRGLEASRIRLGVVQPGENIADFNDALNTLHGSLSYLYNSPNGSRYWYDVRPTLRKTAEDRASQVNEVDVNMEIESRLKKLRKENPFAGLHVCPASSLDVPDEQAVRLVILRTSDTYKSKNKRTQAMETVESILNTRGTSPRIYRNMLAFVAPDLDNMYSLQAEVKRFIAWKSIMSDKDDLNLDGNQIRETQNNLDRSNQTVELRIKETYCWLLVPFIAHVLIEEDADVCKFLKDSCRGMNSHHGSIGIYYPGSSAPYKIITPRRYEGQEETLIDRIVNMVCRYMNQQARDKMMTWEGVQNELLKLRYVSATEKKAKAENEVSEVYENFSDELEEKERTIEELNNRVMALQAENQGLRAKYEQVSEIPLIYYGEEDELYEGEIKDHILETLQKQMQQVKKGTRKEIILQDILESNELTGALEEKRAEIKRILKGYTKVGDSLKRDLKAYGFIITKDGGHYKLTYKGDSRYLFTMASSGSDSQRGGENLIGDIIRDML